MAAASLTEELTCAVCLGLYRDPVALPCQHSFCAKCIGDFWEHSVTRFGVNCPQCRRNFKPRPSLVKNHTLQNIVEKYSQCQPSAPAARPSPVMCEYCTDSPSPAVKTCLKCETSFCTHHLQPHLTKQIYKDHGLIEPIADLTTRQCPTHKKVLEFYCEQDQECVCISCTVIGKHKSHSLLTVEEAKDKIKGKLQSEVKNLREHQNDCTSKQQSLKHQESEIKRHIKEMRKKLSTEFSGWRKQLEEDEKTVLKMIDDEEQRVLNRIKSESGSLVEKMDKLQLIDKESQDQDQKDALSFIQDVKKLLARCSQLGNITPSPDVAVYPTYLHSNYVGSNPYFKQAYTNEMALWAQFGNTTPFRNVAVPLSHVHSNHMGSIPYLNQTHVNEMKTNTTSQDIRVDLSTITSSIQMKMNEYQKYQRSILETINEKSRQLH